MNEATAIKDFHDHYHRKVISSPMLYIHVSGDFVDVILPNALIEYANAASGHTGFGSGARARGLRRKANNTLEYRNQIFETVESLTKFLHESEMDAEAYVSGVRARHAGMPSKGRTKKFKVDIQGALAAFHKAHGSDYKATGADAVDIRAAMQEHLDTVIGKPNQANMDIATRLAFEPYKI